MASNRKRYRARHELTTEGFRLFVPELPGCEVRADSFGEARALLLDGLFEEPDADLIEWAHSPASGRAINYIPQGDGTILVHDEETGERRVLGTPTSDGEPEP